MAEERGALDLENDELTITPLGAGQEVGRSCIMLQFKGKKIMLDCGIHPGLSGIDSLPFLDMFNMEEIDLLLISHFHLDHCGALPYFLSRTTFKGRCFMTHATKAIYRCLLADCIKVSNLSSDQMLYSEKDLEDSMDKIETINFHEEKEVNGIRFWCYNAGHVLGASMFMIEIAGVKVLYTGDFSRQEDRHLMSAEIPNIRPDVLIIESTYGTHIHEKREEREARFTGIVHDTVSRGGRCLIPVFALGRAQELLLILDEFWSLHPELHHIPIYYASSLAKKCMAVYQTYINAMNERIKKQIAISNPFVFKHISNLKSIDHFDDVGPCVVMATPGMMQSGLSRELFESWCPDSRNTCIIAGYCVEGTLAKQILAEPEEIITLAGAKLARKCQIEYISFSAHTDYYQTSEFVRTLRPPHIVLVHGEANEMNRLKGALNREYEDDLRPPTLHNPKNTESVRLHFRGEKIAKVSAWFKRNACRPHILTDEQLIRVLNETLFSKHERIDLESLNRKTKTSDSTSKQQSSLLVTKSDERRKKRSLDSSETESSSESSETRGDRTSLQGTTAESSLPRNGSKRSSTEHASDVEELGKRVRLSSFVSDDQPADSSKHELNEVFADIRLPLLDLLNYDDNDDGDDDDNDDDDDDDEDDEGEFDEEDDDEELDDQYDDVGDFGGEGFYNENAYSDISELEQDNVDDNDDDGEEEDVW